MVFFGEHLFGRDVILTVIIISIIQGVTEFLPVSSSGHIFLLKRLFEFNMGNLFDIAIHFGTLISVCIYFRREIGELLTGVFKEKFKSELFETEFTRGQMFFVWLLFIVATIPGALAGYFLNDPLDIEPRAAASWWFLAVAGFFCITAGLLLLTRFIRPTEKYSIKTLPLHYALIIGLFQALAILPGVSRSGSTISISLLLGLNKKNASKFSFILSIPLILGATLLKVVELITGKITVTNNDIVNLLAGILVSAVVGYFSLFFLIRLLQKGKFWFFAIYLIIPFLAAVAFSFIY